MANKKNKNNKKKIKMSGTHIGILISILVVVVALVTILIVSASKKDYYECTLYKYVDTEKDNVSMNMLEAYKTIRIYLKDDSNFYLEMVTQDGVTDTSYHGLYTKTDTELSLLFNSGVQPGFHYDIENWDFKIDGKKLTRTIATRDNYQVKQEFKLKK